MRSAEPASTPLSDRNVTKTASTPLKAQVMSVFMPSASFVSRLFGSSAPAAAAAIMQ